MSNEKIRADIRAAGLKNYEVAVRTGISTSLFYQWLQRPLTADQQKRITTAIKELKKEKRTR